MSHEERNNVVAIVMNLVVMSIFIWRVWSLQQEGVLDRPDGLQIWAQTFLWIIPLSIVVGIVGVVLFNILFAIATGDSDPSFVVDERDRLISLRGMTVTSVVASAGFIGAMVVLAFGGPVLVALNIAVAGFALGDLFGSVAKLTLYRRAA